MAQRAGDGVSAASAGYWLAAAQSQLDNPREARAILEEVLASVRGGVRVTSDFRIRLLIALATVESQEEAHDHALAYLEEARGLASDLDDLRRARFLFNLAVEYQQTADYEAALRTASQSAALFRAAQADRELAALENTTALTFLGMGNLERAEESLQRARDAVTGEDDPFAPHVAETEARLALAEGRIDAARLAASKAIELAREAGYHKTVALALLTRAEAELQANEPIAALATFEDAATIAREHGGRGLLRRVLGRWAETLTSLGRLEEATKLYQEALSA